MQTTKQSLLRRTWRRDSYLVSTDASLIPVSELNKVFATDLVYWANPLPEEMMRDTLDNSLCFGLYDTNTQANSSRSKGEIRIPKALTLIGFARCVTDFSTFSYLTDVYVLPSHQGEGLGRWILQCVSEVHESMPHLRRSMLFTSDWKRSVPFYERVLGMETINGDDKDIKSCQGPAVMQKLGPGFPGALR